MSTSRRRYSREFKLKVVRRVQELGRTKAKVEFRVHHLAAVKNHRTEISIKHQ